MKNILQFKLRELVRYMCYVIQSLFKEGLKAPQEFFEPVP